MEEKIIINYMRTANIWWSEEFNIDYHDRKIYGEIIKFMKTRQIVAITGLRRVGKTTTMLKIIKTYIDSNFPKKNLFYFSFDEYSEIRIRDVIEIYEKNLGLSIKSGKYLFAFDEIQKVKNWSEQLKTIYDLYPNIKFVISGSESLFIKRKSRESLAGRIYEFFMQPLNFKEFLNFRGIKVENLFLQQEQIEKEFKKYLITNGFPEITNEEKEIAQKYIQESIIEKIIYRDITEVFEVKNPIIIRSIFNILYNHPGQLIEVQSLAKEIGITRQALSEYLGYLEQAYLIRKLYNYSRNARKTERRLKKYYTTIINPLLIETEFPKIFEQFLAIELDGVYFWRDPYKNEVDIIKINPLTAIEIKSGEIKERDISSLIKFIEKFHPKEAFIISYNIEKTINNIKIIPFYKYLFKK